MNRLGDLDGGYRLGGRCPRVDLLHAAELDPPHIEEKVASGNPPLRQGSQMRGRTLPQTCYMTMTIIEHYPGLDKLSNPG